MDGQANAPFLLLSLSGRAPALLDSLDQALLTAPLFVLLEIFFFFGYKRAMHRRMMAQVEKNVKRFKGGKSK